MIYIDNLKNLLNLKTISVAKIVYYCCLCFHRCQKIFLCYYYIKISAWTHIVLGSDEGMKPGDEALTASLLQFFRSVKRFIAIIFFSLFTFFRGLSLNASLALLFKVASSLNVSSPLLFSVTLPTSGNNYKLCTVHTFIQKRFKCGVLLLKKLSK